MRVDHRPDRREVVRTGARDVVRRRPRAVRRCRATSLPTDVAIAPTNERQVVDRSRGRRRQLEVDPVGHRRERRWRRSRRSSATSRSRAASASRPPRTAVQLVGRRDGQASRGSPSTGSGRSAAPAPAAPRSRSGRRCRRRRPSDTAGSPSGGSPAPTTSRAAPSAMDRAGIPRRPRSRRATGWPNLPPRRSSPRLPLDEPHPAHASNRRRESEDAFRAVIMDPPPTAGRSIPR